MTFSYEEMKLLSEILWVAIENGNRAEGKPFDPTPEQYKQICNIANKIDKDIKPNENHDIRKAKIVIVGDTPLVTNKWGIVDKWDKHGIM